jgi:hypothetical protein
MVNNSTNINKINNYITTLIIVHKKKDDILGWKSKSWLGTGTKMLQVKLVNGIQTLTL